MTRTLSSIALVAFVVGCGIEPGTVSSTSGKVTGALTPTLGFNLLPEMDSTWRETVPAIQPILSGWIPADFCPEPVIKIHPSTVVSPPSAIHLDGTWSVPKSGAITHYLWFLNQPPENSFNLVPTLAFPEPTHAASAPGTYRYCLDVIDGTHGSQELDCLSTACVEVEALQVDGIHIDLTWKTPSDLYWFDEGPEGGADMDLHFVHPFAEGPDGWFDLGWDCFWYNPGPVWNDLNPNTNDQPHLVVDDTNGFGPEIIVLEEPSTATYVETTLKVSHFRC